MSPARGRRSAPRLRAARSHPRRPSLFAAGVGAGAALTLRALAPRLLLLKLQRDVRALNAGDIQPLLANYSRDAVLRFNEGEHRWAGEHRGRDAIALFLQSFLDAGLQGGHAEDPRARAPPVRAGPRAFSLTATDGGRAYAWGRG